MKKLLGSVSVLMLLGVFAQAQTKPVKPSEKHVSTASSKKAVDTVSKKVAVVASKEQKKMPVHKHTHQAKVVKS